MPANEAHYTNERGTGIPQHIIIRQLGHFAEADAGYAAKVKEKLKALG